MNAERWRRIEDLYHLALERSSETRGAFLDQNCPDPGLRREVESLLRHRDDSGVQPPSATVEDGARLGPYEILGGLGVGGMGTVHRAVDTRIGRVVAIKICRETLSGRFAREARAIAALNHPRVCTLHDLGHERGIQYLVMEYVEGETLADRLDKGRIPTAEALRYGIEILDGLTAAHAHGIVHRDVKPGNIMLTKSGVKVLDFGLAKTPELAAALADSDTVTRTGTILGTPHYMSPEQVQGRAVDARSDIFSFGLVLYEMLAGCRAFDGDTVAGVMAAILEREPPALDPRIPVGVRRLLLRCLAKAPDDRWQSARDLKAELEWAAGAPPPTSKRNARVLWVAAALFAIFAAAVLLPYFRRTPHPRVVQFQIAAVGNVPLAASDLAQVSPDGTRIAFTAGQRLFVRPLDSPSPQELPGTQGATAPFWSADGRYLIYQAFWKVWKIALDGGPPVAISDGVIGGPGLAFSRDGVILFPARDHPGLARIGDSGGALVPVTSVNPSNGETLHAWPSFLPDGKHFLFTIYSTDPAHGGVFAGSLDSPAIERLLPDQTNAQYSDPGYLLFGRGGLLLAQSFDADKRRSAGDAFPITSELAQGNAPLRAASFSAAPGVLIYGSGRQETPKLLRLVDRGGIRIAEVGPPGEYWEPALSHDGRLAAVAKQTGPVTDIWTFDLVRGGSSRLTFGEVNHGYPVFSPDTRQIAYAYEDPRGWSVRRAPANGAGKEEVLFETGRNVGPTDWTSGGFLIAYVFGFTGASEIWAARLTDLGHRYPLLARPAQLSGGRVSPDGKWIAYTSQETGRREIYVQSFPPTAGKWQLSTAGGEQPKWRGDGRELFFREGTKMMAVDVKTSAAGFESGIPRVLFDVPTAIPHFDATDDGRKFLLALPNRDAGPQQTFTVVLNWPEGLKR